jgi:hypothetical protein
MEEPRPILKVAIAFAWLAVLAAIAIPNFIREPNTSPKNECINNLRQIDGAIQQWALENNKTNSDIPTWTDLKGYLGRGETEIPKCPLGGTYTLGPVGDKPRCSVAGHGLP